MKHTTCLKICMSSCKFVEALILITNNHAEEFKDNDPPEDHDNSITTSWGGPTADDALRGRKHGLSMVLLGNLEPKEQCEMEEDQDADKDVQEDVDMIDQQGDIEMSVSVMETTMDNQTPKYIKTKNGHAPCTLNQKREKPKNSHLPSGAQNLTFCSVFIPMVVHWVRNSNYPWTILEQKISDILKDISMVVYPTPGNFQYDNGCNLTFTLVSQRISE
ncbi:hypothetical protein EV424DRAFT_1342902 [Suillus variegatus]|nr:hypothetical protein EV424DRAFT_1342902 [Suillus variegatus]